MVGELGKPARARRRPEGLELLADGSVQSHALSHREITVEGLTNQRVCEAPRIGGSLARDQEPEPCGLVERLQRVVGRTAADGRQRRHLEVAPQHRRGLQDVPATLRERPEPVPDHVARVVGDAQSIR